MMDELEAKGFNAQKVCVCDNKCSKSSNDVILYYFCFTVLLSVATSAESEKKKKIVKLRFLCNNYGFYNMYI